MPGVPSRRRLVSALMALLALIPAACGDDDGNEAASTSSTTQPAPLTILVTNDDGYAAPGIDAVVEALRKEPKVHIDVVAPATNQSGQGEKTTPGELAVEDVRTKSGYPATSVAGYPADAVNVAFDKLHLRPDVVVSGTNTGHNLGELVKVSGTVGAAKTAAKHGVPALAASTGRAANLDYAGSAVLVVEWFREHRAAQRGDATVESLNVPTCTVGKRRGLVHTKLAASSKDRQVSGDANCLSSKPKAKLIDDVDAFLNGFATLTTVPLG